MTPEIRWTFEVDAAGIAQLARGGGMAAVETVQPGEYLVTLPMPLSWACGVRAAVDGGFITATPGDDAGNKPARLRVLTLTPDDDFGPGDFTLVVSHALSPGC